MLRGTSSIPAEFADESDDAHAWPMGEVASHDPDGLNDRKLWEQAPPEER
jgi:hypothetical protein